MENNQENEGFYYVKLALLQLKNYWYYFLISVIACLGVAYFVNWYMQPVYEVGNLILINGKSTPGTSDPAQDFMKSFSIFNSADEINKEMEKMSSLELIYKALVKTNADINYYGTTKEIKKIDLYVDCPFKVIINKDHIQPLDVKFILTRKSGYTFNLSVESKDELVYFYNYDKNEVVSSGTFTLNKDYEYGDTVETPSCSFIIQLDNDKVQNFKSHYKYSFVFNNLNVLMYQYQKKLKIDQVGKDVQAVSIKLKVKNPQKGIDFINALTQAYMERNVAKKNLAADNVIKYIDRELSTTESALSTNESDLQRFRSSNRMMEIKSLSDQAFKKANDLEAQKSELEMKERYYEYILNNLKDDEGSTNIMIPSSMGVNDQVLTGIIDQYISLNTQRNNLIQNKKTLSPYFITLSNKVEVQRKTLLSNIQNMMQTNNVVLTSINNKLGQENAKISLLPGTERGLVGIERKQSLNDEVYKFLLHKKAEAQIAKGSSLPDNDILEDAKLTQIDPVAPNKLVNFLAAFAAGIFFPFVFFGIKVLFNNKVTDEKMLLTIAPYPIVGSVYRKRRQKKVAILSGSSKSPISESIRSIRTNVEHFSQGEKSNVVLMSSCMSGDGKSFCSLNLAHSLALAKRKTILLDFDLRKPNQYLNLAAKNKLGIAAYLKGEANVNDIINHAEIECFDFIRVGEVPPNPAELIDSDFTKTLITTLKEDYEYIIIDTAPVGLVWETFSLMKFADLKIIVVRENYTDKNQLITLVDKMKNRNIENAYWLLNGVDVRETEYGKKNPYYAKS